MLLAYRLFRSLLSTSGLAALLSLTGTVQVSSPAAAATTGSIRAAAHPPPISHIFVINLENESFASTFGPGSPATYLNHTLLSKGELIPNYYAIGHVSLDNYIAT